MRVRQTRRGRSRRWSKRKNRHIPAPFYARLAIAALLAVLIGTLTWHGMRFVFRGGGGSGNPQLTAASAAPMPAVALWQSDALASIESGAREAQAGNITAAEVAVDRAASMIEAARVESRAPSSDFFDDASASLNKVLQPRPENARLFEHVTAARIDLAQLRSAIAGPAAAVQSDATSTVTISSLPTASEAARVGAAVPGRTSSVVGKAVSIGGPRDVTPDRVFDPSVLGGDTIDATLMPATLEILLPPSSRLLVDNVRVQNLTIRGASQTLDGIHWKNVTFIGTRLRYESGEIDLRNVHFVRCTFGMPMDQRAARLANAIALGQPSITIE